MISIRGAREHNLRNINVDIPHDSLTVITGLSGSGKSSLALDTLFAEGQRRFMESLSSYARQFLGILQKPLVDRITGLSPAIAIQQRMGNTSLRSTVGTATEIHDYLRVLFAQLGVPHCPKCGAPITPQTPEQIIEAILALPEGEKIEILAPLVKGKKGEHKELLQKARREGFVRVRIDGQEYLLEDAPQLARYNLHTVEVVVDRLVIKKDVRRRLADSVETALKIGGNSVVAHKLGGEDLYFSGNYACPNCVQGEEFPKMEARLFSFNSPYGFCPSCFGLGIMLSDFSKTCPECHGERLNAYSRAVTLSGKTIVDVGKMPLTEALDFFEALQGEIKGEKRKVTEGVLKEIISRIGFLKTVGLGYLNLSRSSVSLSGGEAQRIRLSSQIGTGLTGVLYVLDEPTIGLHPRDNQKLLQALKQLRDLKNTVVLVEHDAEVIRNADYVVDMGPGAGVEGGNVIFQGTYEKLLKCKNSLTADYLSGKREIKIPVYRPVGPETPSLVLKGACHNNLKNLTVRFPLGRLICVTGVSGSGKSSLVTDTLLPALRKHYHNAKGTPGAFKEIEGLKYLDKVIVVDQSPLGRTPRSNPATYTEAFAHIRNIFAQLPEAKLRGYKSGRFSFNVKGGRCEECEGSGVKKVEMHFLPDVFVTCDKCEGKRYNKETLEIKYRGKNISEVLDMPISEAKEFFRNHKVLSRILGTISEVGLDYITLGQHATTLSGGEAQRVKLSYELARVDTGRTLYVLDEPTTGLHFADVERLIQVLQKLVDAGNTVIVIEHNLEFIKCADHVIDLGPDGGAAGGRLLACGSPYEVALDKNSVTGRFLRDILPPKAR
jgi:excinuclease ABC subunit A